MYITLKEAFKNNPKDYKKLLKKLTSKDPKEKTKAELAIAKYNMEMIKVGTY